MVSAVSATMEMSGAGTTLVSRGSHTISASAPPTSG